MLRPAPNELVWGNGPPQDSPGSDPTTVTHIGTIEYVNRSRVPASFGSNSNAHRAPGVSGSDVRQPNARFGS